MCGRFTVTTQPAQLLDDLGIAQTDLDFQPRYNIAPQQPVLAVLRRDGALRAEPLRWGLIPFWAKDPAIGNKMINARAETVAEKPAYRAAFGKRRCVVIADGFYEWRAAAGGKQPMRIRLASQTHFAMAGLWESWRPPEGDPVLTCTVITTTANEHMRTIHDRMPVILDSETVQLWLNPAASAADLTALLAPYAGELDSYPVSRLVNSPRNDIADCIAPVQPEELQLL